MAVLLRKRLFNPGGRTKRRKLTARQKLFFGTKRQRATVKNGSKSSSHRRKNSKSSSRVRNIGEIITVSLPRKKSLTNPMPRRRRRVSRRRNAPKSWSSLYRKAYKATGKRRRRNSSASKPRHRRRNSSATKVITRYRTRTRNPRRRVRRYYGSRRRRNPGFLTSNLSKVAGILGGAALTNIIARQIPIKYTTGTLGYATLTGVALVQGWAVKKVLRNDALAEDMMIGGLVLVAIKVMSDLFPSISLGLGGRGLGLIGNSSFPIPQVPVAGSMGRFLIPPNYQSAINSAIPAPIQNVRGIGAITMGGSTRARRVGRIN